MIGKKRIVRKLESIAQNGTVVDLPPSWCFTIVCKHHGDILLDFEKLRDGREDLALHCRNAVWSLRHDLVGITLQGLLRTLASSFWPFLDQNNMSITRLNQIDETVIKAYLAWLHGQQVGIGKRKGQLFSISGKKNAYAAVKCVLVNRQKRVPLMTNSALKFPKSPFPNINRLTPKREPYSKGEQNSITAACNQDLQLIHGGEKHTLSPAQVLAVHLLVLALATGRNLQGLLELQRDSLKGHPLKDREILITEKRRSGSQQVSSYLANSSERPAGQEQIITIPVTIGHHFRWLAEYTRPLMESARKDDRSCIFLWNVPYTGRHPKSTRQGAVNRFTQPDAKNALDDFVRRHILLSDSGDPLPLNIARCRPTFGTNLYARTRDIRKVQLALGHASAETTARHYVSAPIEAARDHVFVGQAMVGWATSTDEAKAKAMVVAADGKIPLENVRELLRGGYNTVVARCKNPFREGGEVCGKYMACFKCPQMVVFEDDLWRMFSFYYKLLFERNKIAPHHWVKTYGWVIKTIDNDISSQFSADAVEEAKRKAIETPHPAWAV